MLPMEPFLSFLAVAAVAMLVPGPDTFVVLRTALAEGPRAGTWAAAGSAAGNLLWGAASVLGGIRGSRPSNGPQGWGTIGRRWRSAR